MSEFAQQTVGALVTNQPQRARFFERIGIDYCCGGHRTLSDACTEAGKDIAIVTAALEEFDRIAPANTDVNPANMTANELIDHIVSKHHEYLRQELPRLSYLTSKVANRHGDMHPELPELHKLYEAFRIVLENHLESEEKVLFPAIREFVKNGVEDVEPGHTLGIVVKEHDSAGADLRAMRKLTNGFLPPSDACNSYRAMLEGLASLEHDVHEHVHKENNILFPMVKRTTVPLS